MADPAEHETGVVTALALFVMLLQMVAPVEHRRPWRPACTACCCPRPPVGSGVYHQGLCPQPAPLWVFKAWMVLMFGCWMSRVTLVLSTQESPDGETPLWTWPSSHSPSAGPGLGAGVQAAACGFCRL